MSSVAIAAAALAGGRHEDARLHARRALAGAEREELPELARIAAEVNDTALLTVVTVRRLRPSRRREVADMVGSAIAYGIAYAWWLGWALLVTLTTMSNRLVAVAISTISALLIVVGITRGWIETDD